MRSLYVVQVLKTNLSDLGWIRTAPYLIMFATSNLGAWLGDYLISTRKVSTAGARKTVNTLGALQTLPDVFSGAQCNNIRCAVCLACCSDWALNAS